MLRLHDVQTYALFSCIYLLVSGMSINNFLRKILTGCIFMIIKFFCKVNWLNRYLTTESLLIITFEINLWYF